MRARRAVALSAAALALAALLSSCDYLLGDPYPAYAQRMEASTDLDAAVEAASGGSPIQEIGKINYLESSGSSAVFVALYTKDGVRRLLTLDGESLKAPVSYSINYSFTEVGLAASGHYLFYGPAGWVALEPGSRLVDGTLSAALSSISSFTTLLNEAGYNYFPYVFANDHQNLDQYDLAFISILVPWLNIWIDMSASSWTLTSAGQGGGYYCFLYNIYNSNRFRAFRTPSLTAMPSLSSIFVDPSVPDDYKTAEFSSDQSRVWVTADGVVTASNDNDGIVFTLRPFGSSASTSSYTLKDESSASFSFEPSGRYWFMYEKASGRLYKLRTWW